MMSGARADNTGSPPLLAAAAAAVSAAAAAAALSKAVTAPGESVFTRRLTERTGETSSRLVSRHEAETSSPGNPGAVSPMLPATPDEPAGSTSPSARLDRKGNTCGQAQHLIRQTHRQPQALGSQTASHSFNEARLLLDPRDPREVARNYGRDADDRPRAGSKLAESSSPRPAATRDDTQPAPLSSEPVSNDVAPPRTCFSPPAIPNCSTQCTMQRRSRGYTRTDEGSHAEKWDVSDDKYDVMDVDESRTSSPTISGHSIDIDPQAQGDLRRLALENTDTLEQLAKKASMAATGAAADRARSLFVTSWLIENYEVEEDHNVPRISLYSHYLKYCQQQGLRPVNSASFGKLIRSVFPELKTRRLGTRGQSKYHYCGIKIRKPSRSCANAAAAAAVRAVPVMTIDTQGHRSDKIRYRKSLKSGALSLQNGDETHQQQQNQLDQPPPTNTLLRDLPDLPESSTPPGFGHSDVMAFVDSYRGHCQDILDYVEHMRFGSVEHIIKGFWFNLPSQHREMLKSDQLVDWIFKTDAVLYDTVIGLMMPNVLQPMPLAVIQAVRLFARSLDMWLHAALAGYPPPLVAKKLEVAGVFSGQLRRYTSLNHLVRAAQSVFLDQERLRKMLKDWSEIDFESIRDQASWVCECNKADLMQIMEVEFPQLLANGSRLENWTEWISGIVDRFLTESMGTKSYMYTARQLLLKWSFYTSLAMRDLTLRSAESFGSFHLVHLLYDEYLFYIVEQKIANFQMKTSVEKPAGSVSTSSSASSSSAAGRGTTVAAGSSSAVASGYQQQVVDQTALGSLQQTRPSRPAEPLLPIHTPYPPVSQAQEIALAVGHAYSPYASPPVPLPGVQQPEYACTTLSASDIKEGARRTNCPASSPPCRGRKRGRGENDSGKRTTSPASVSASPVARGNESQGRRLSQSEGPLLHPKDGSPPPTVEWPAIPVKLGIADPRTLMVSTDADNTAQDAEAGCAGISTKKAVVEDAKA